jgi:hypothetical protein
LRRVVLFVAFFVFAHRSAAQQLRGAVRDSATNTPISAAVVTLLDAAGNPGQRTITDADGRFTLSNPSRAPRMRVVRIGYRPRDVALSAQPDASLVIGMERIPPMLERVRVSDRALCPGSTDRGSAFQLWDQARAGLLAAVVARELRPAMAKTLMYESGMSPIDERIHRQTKQMRSGRTTRPFISSAGP